MINKHKATLDAAVQALHGRTFFAAFPENPSPEIYGADADAQGRAKFAAQRGQHFTELQQGEPEAWVGQEESPYEQQPLGVQYPFFSAETVVKNAQGAFAEWRKLKPALRAALLTEALEGMKNRFFEIAYATMHTTGQAYMMSFQASGPHAADRALEAIAAGYEEQTRFPEETRWEKPMGKYSIALHKPGAPCPRGWPWLSAALLFPPGTRCRACSPPS